MERHCGTAIREPAPLIPVREVATVSHLRCVFYLCPRPGSLLSWGCPPGARQLTIGQLRSLRLLMLQSGPFRPQKSPHRSRVLWMHAPNQMQMVPTHPMGEGPLMDVHPQTLGGLLRRLMRAELPVPGA